MKNLKRVMALLMAATMTASLAACGGKSDDTPSSGSSQGGSQGGSQSGASQDTEVKWVERIDPATNKPYDLGGIDVVVRDWWTAYPGDANAEKTAYEIAMEEYMKKCEDTYNFHFTRMQIDGWGDCISNFTTYVTEGGDSTADANGKNGQDYYIWTLRQANETVAAMDAELMYDVNTLDCLNLKDTKWDTTIFSMTKNVKGQQCCFRAEPHEQRTGVFFNKRLLKEAGIDPAQIYEWQRKKEWTWDKFEEVLEKCTRDTDGDQQTDVYGMVCFGSRFYPAMVYSNNAEFIGKKDGKYTYNLENPETLEALTRGLKWMENYNRPQGDENWDYFGPVFRDGKEAVFWPGEEIYNASTLKRGNGKEETADDYIPPMKDDYGFVCFPMGPNMVKTLNKYADYNGDNLYAIPACYTKEEAWKVAFVYDLWTDPIPGYNGPEPWVANSLPNFCDDESVLESMQFLTEFSMPTNQSFVQVDMGEGLLWKFNSDSNTPAQQAESVREEWKRLIGIANGEISADE